MLLSENMMSVGELGLQNILSVSSFKNHLRGGALMNSDLKNL